MKTALLILDMQHALCTGVEAAFDIDNVIRRINEISRQARKNRSPVVLIQHEEAESPLRHGSESWASVTGLITSAEDIRIRKRTANSFFQTNLHEVLQQLGISRLIICGLQTECCIDTTVRQALQLGYDVTLAADAHSTVDGVISADKIIAHHNRTLQFLPSFGPKMEVKQTAEITIDI